MEEEAFDRLQRQGCRGLRKKAAKEVVEQILRRTPLVIVFIAISTPEVVADVQKRGIGDAWSNQLIPIELVEDVASGAQRRMDQWLGEGGFHVRKKRFRNIGFSDDEATAMAYEYMLQSFKKKQQ